MEKTRVPTVTMKIALCVCMCVCARIYEQGCWTGFIDYTCFASGDDVWKVYMHPFVTSFSTMWNIVFSDIVYTWLEVYT